MHLFPHRAIAVLVPKLTPLLIFKVNVAALEAWGEMCKHASKAQESFLDRVMSSAFLRAVDHKGVVRNAALTAIISASRVYPPDSFLSALHKCLNSAKVGRGGVGALGSLSSGICACHEFHGVVAPQSD